MSLYDDLLEQLKKCESLPVLFIGSGISRRYLNLDDWENLLRNMTSLVNSNKYAFENYREKASLILKEQNQPSTKNQLFPLIAELIEKDINAVWYEDEKFSETREIYKDLIPHGVSPFKIEIAHYIKKKSVIGEIEPYLLEELELLKQTAVSSLGGVITTNYDLLLENIFTDFDIYISQEELIFSPIQGISELYKIHGSCENPDSIVITRQDYKNFLEKNKYLAAKLLTIFLEHPVIFLGYSINDENIEAILESIVDCLNANNLKKLKNRLIFIERADEGEEDNVSIYSKAFGINRSIDMTRIRTNSFKNLFETLLKNKSKYSSKLLKRLKKDIYEVAIENKPNKRLTVLLDITEDKLDDYEIVVGVGLVEFGKRGYKSISTTEVFKDIVFDDAKFNTSLLVQETLPTLLKHTSGSLPFYKYISTYDSELPSIFSKYLKTTYNEFLNSNILKRKISEESIEEIIKNHKNLVKQIRLIPVLKENQINVDALEKFLKRLLTNYPNILNDKTQNINSDVKRLIKIYDWLKYSKK